MVVCCSGPPGLSVNILPVHSAPGGLVLEPNQYRAASQLMLSCQVTGATGTLTYSWSSTCSGDCFFLSAMAAGQNISTLDRGDQSSQHNNFLRSSDSGVYTCEVTDGGSGAVGRASREVQVVGE